jgi:succinate dehydrogenase / fumarate reductase flavoprotein subunit
MQRQVGIVRQDGEMRAALAGLEELRRRSARVAVPGNREYNPGWHTALDLDSLLMVSEAITRAALERRESRGAQFREDHPHRDDALAGVNVAVRRGPDGEMQVRRTALPAMTAEQRRVIEEAH